MLEFKQLAAALQVCARYIVVHNATPHMQGAATNFTLPCGMLCCSAVLSMKALAYVTVLCAAAAPAGHGAAVHGTAQQAGGTGGARQQQQQQCGPGFLAFTGLQRRRDAESLLHCSRQSRLPPLS